MQTHITPVGQGGKKEMAQRMILACRRRQLKGPGQMGWGPAPFFFLFDLVCSPLCYSSPMNASIARDGVGCFTLCA